MSEKYVAKKYVTVTSLTDRTAKCPNCHQRMAITVEGIFHCVNDQCKLYAACYREVKSLTTIEKVK